MFSSTICSALLAVAIAIPQSEATNQSTQTWVGFRGDGTNITQAKEMPITWSPEKGIAWSVDIPGYGQSSPVIWKDKIFLTSIEGANKEKCFVHAFNLKDGIKLWTQKFAATQRQKNSFMTSRAAPTSAVDANSLYVFFESGELICLDHQGKTKWERSLAKEYGKTESMHGLGASLTQTKEAIIVLVADSQLSYLLAVNKKTGKNLWKIDREKKTSWTSPVVTYRKGKPEVIVSANGVVEGFDGTNGKALWKLDGISGNTIPSVCISGEYILVGAAESRRNPNPKIASQSNCCLRLIKKEEKPSYEIVWSAKKAISYYSTPLAYQGRAYYVNKVGAMYCLDMKTGKQLFVKRIKGSCWASPLGANGHIYFFTKRGPTVVIKASQKFEMVSTNQLVSKKEEDSKTSKPAKGGMAAAFTGTIVYGVAAVEGTFIIRTGKKLYCIRKETDNK